MFKVVSLNMYVTSFMRPRFLSNMYTIPNTSLDKTNRVILNIEKFKNFFFISRINDKFDSEISYQISVHTLSDFPMYFIILVNLGSMSWKCG